MGGHCHGVECDWPVDLTAQTCTERVMSYLYLKASFNFFIFLNFKLILPHLLTFCRSDRTHRVSLQCADGREQWGSWPGWRLCHKLHKHRASLLLKRFCTISSAVANMNIWLRRNILIRWMRYLCECARVAAELQGHWRLSYSEHRCMVSPHCEHAHVSSDFLQDTLRQG